MKPILEAFQIYYENLLQIACSEHLGAYWLLGEFLERPGMEKATLDHRLNGKGTFRS
jgi:hypothetical protein